jgi:hypothetical protein
MKKSTRRRKLIGISFLFIILLAVPALVLAQEGEGEDEDAITCNPGLERLATEMGIECSALMDYRADGVGLGNMMKAIHLSQSLTGFDETWESLLARKQAEGLGWGQFKMAQRLAGDSYDPNDLLNKKQEGYGWGHIKKALALDAAGIISFDDALNMTEADLDWDKIREENGYPPGPPPWAASGKDKDKTGHGPPPWANAGGKDKDKDKNKDNGD